jgi:hypothetical protein
MQRRLAAPPNPKEVAESERERDDFMRFQIIWVAAQRGERGLAELAGHQRRVRPDCLLCRRPFQEAGGP